MARSFALVLFAAACAARAAEDPPPKGRPPSDAEADVRAAARAVREATLRRDAAALKPLLADTFSGLTPVDTRLDRDGWLDGVAKGTLLAAHKADEMEDLGDDLTVHAPGVATHTSLWRFRIAATNRFLMARKYRDAADDFTAAIRVNDRQAQSYFGGHLAFAALGEGQRSDADRAKARELSPTVGKE
jgi:hypothetical protein